MLMRRGVGRRGAPLMRAAATTAVVAGTATAVHGSMTRHQDAKAQQAADAAAYQQMQQEAAMQQAAAQAVAAQQAAYAPPPPPAPAPAAAPAGDDTVAKLQQLADLHNQGILSDEEFAAAKAKLLS
jgi:hypothetical protein